MTGHPLLILAVALAGLTAAIATRVELLPEVVDLSSIPTAAGLGGLLAAGCGAALRFPPDRVAKVTLFGDLAGAVVGALFIALALVRDVLS